MDYDTHIRITWEEKTFLRKLAADNNITASKMIRKLIADEAARQYGASISNSATLPNSKTYPLEFKLRNFDGTQMIDEPTIEIPLRDVYHLAGNISVNLHSASDEDKLRIYNEFMDKRENGQ